MPSHTDQQRGRRKPISDHPLFAVMVALWFGALLGLGSLAVSPATLQVLVAKIHLAELIPAATPPLGVTARILISVLMALLGGLIGAAIARRIIGTEPEQRGRRRRCVPGGKAHGGGPSDLVSGDRFGPRKPISAHEELGAEMGPVVPLGDDTAEKPAIDGIDHDMSLPGVDQQTLAAAEFMFDPAPSMRSLDATADTDASTDGDTDTEGDNDTEADTPPSASMPELSQRLTQLSDAPASIDRPQPASDDVVSSRPATIRPLLLAPTSGPSADRIARAELGALSLLELIDRLAMSMDRHRTAKSISANAPMNIAASRPAAPPDEDADDVPVLPFALRLASRATPVDVATESTTADEGTSAPTSSLPDVGPDVSDASETVGLIAPTQGEATELVPQADAVHGPDREQTEHALRAALSTLRRMSGAA